MCEEQRTLKEWLLQNSEIGLLKTHKLNEIREPGTNSGLSSSNKNIKLDSNQIFNFFFSKK